MRGYLYPTGHMQNIRGLTSPPVSVHMHVLQCDGVEIFEGRPCRCESCSCNPARPLCGICLSSARVERRQFVSPPSQELPPTWLTLPMRLEGKNWAHITRVSGVLGFWVPIYARARVMKARASKASFHGFEAERRTWLRIGRCGIGRETRNQWS